MGQNPTKAAGNIYCQKRKEAAKFNDRLNSREGYAILVREEFSCLEFIMNRDTINWILK